MLNTFRTKIKFWSHIFLWPVIISFIAFYGWSFLDRPQETTAAAIVGDTQISWRQVVENRRQLHRYYRQLYKDNFERMAENLDFNEMALEQLISQTLLNMQAEEFGVTVSTQEIQNSIQSIPAFQRNGAFSSATYQRVLQRMGMTPAEYEASVGNDLVLQKTRALISAAAPVTEDELKKQYLDMNVKINCDYLAFMMPDFKEGLEETPEAIEAYYNENQEEFRVGDQILVNYLKIEPATFKKDVEIYDIDVEDYYDQHFTEFEIPEKIRASHILFKVDQDADEAAENLAKENAEKAIERIQNGEDFATVAQELSEGPTGPKGGDLGFFGKGRMDPAFEKAAWDLEIDAITETPVKSRFGWHVIKKTDYQKQSWKPVDQVRSQIENKIKDSESKILAMTAAQNLFDQVEPGVTTLESLTTDTNYTVEKTEFFEPAKSPREIGYARNLNDILSNLEEKEISIPVETNRGIFIFELVAEKASHIPAFEEVKEEAVGKYQNGTATKLALAKAEEIRQSILNGKTWDEVVAENSLESKNTGLFTNGYSVPGIGGDEDIVDELFAMKQVDEISKAYEIRSNAYLFRLVEREDFDQAKFEKEIPRLRQQLLTRRENSVVNSWLEQMKADLQKQGKYQINTREEL